MALPTSPSIVVLENDVSIYTPNINSSVVGIVGFADKGPTDKATLITSQANLLKQFGKPSSDIPGQGLEGALEILEATNQVYFVRAADSGALEASADIALGAAPAFELSSSWTASGTEELYYSITDKDGNFKVSGLANIPASDATYNTAEKVLFNTFNPSIFDDQPLYAGVEGDKLFLASKYAGSGATLRLSAAIGSDLRFKPLSSTGDASTVAAGNENDTADITTNGFTVSDVTLRAYSLYPGTGYNLSALRDGSTKGVSVEINNKSVKDQLVVNNEGSQAESFMGSLVFSANDFFEYVLQDDELNAQSDYVYLNAVSSDGTTDYGGFPDIISDKLEVEVSVNGDPDDATPRFVKLIEGTYNLAGGDSGYGSTTGDQPASESETALIGTAAEQTGIHALDDDSLNISIAVVPGVTDDNVQNELITVAETSKNFLALISPPYAVGGVQDALDWLNGKGTRTAAVNSSYAAAYWPWVQVFNGFAGAEQWYDPAIFAARQCVFTDAVAEPWFAPAGLNRGRLTKPTDTEKATNQGDRDALYSNSINPVTKDGTGGIVIFGQKTTQRTPTALDRVNVRRLMIYIRKTLLELAKPFQFEPNDQFTWEKVEDAINPFISDLIGRRAITEGAVKCDSTTNTPLRVDRNELWCSISIKPTKVAETVVFEVNLTSQSATING